MIVMRSYNGSNDVLGQQLKRSNKGFQTLKLSQVRCA